VDGLKDEFAGQIDFFDLDVDMAETAAVRQEFGFTGRSQYALLDAEGNVVRRWFGPLQETMAKEVAAVLRSLEEG
jgi:hypothetical protein